MEDAGTWNSDDDSQVKGESSIAKRVKTVPPAVFFDQQRKKAREQRMKEMRKALLEHLKDVPDVVLKQRLHLNAFHPPSFYPKHVERVHTKPEDFVLVAEDELAEEKAVRNLSEVYRDAETGEVINLTKAKWSSVEGRLNYNRQTIIDMGTGRLNLKRSMSPTTSMKDIMTESMKCSVHSVPSNEEWMPSMETMSITNDRPHPLVKKFLEEGPINLRVHKLWSPKTDALKPQPELRVLYVEEKEKIDEDMVSAKSSLSGGTGTHMSKSLLQLVDGSLVSSNGSGKPNNNAVKNLGSAFGSADSGTVGLQQMLQPVTSVHISKTPTSSPPRGTIGKSRNHTLPSLSHRTHSPVATVENAFGSVSSLGSGKKIFPTKNKTAASSMTLSLSSTDRPPPLIHQPSNSSASVASGSTSKGSKGTKGTVSTVKLSSIWKRPDRTYENEVLYQWYFSRLAGNKLMNDSLSSVSSYDEHLHDLAKLKLESSLGGSLTMGSTGGGWQQLEDGYFHHLYQLATDMDKLRILRSDKGLGCGFGVGNGIDHATMALILDPNPPPINNLNDVVRNMLSVSEKERNFNEQQDRLIADVLETSSVGSVESRDSSIGSMASSSTQNSSHILGKYPKSGRKSKASSGDIPIRSILRKQGNDGSNKSQSSGRVDTNRSSERNSISIIQDDNNSSIHTLSSSGHGGSSPSMMKVPGQPNLSRNNSLDSHHLDRGRERSSGRPTSKNAANQSRAVEATLSSRRSLDSQLKTDPTNPSPSARPSRNSSQNPSRMPSRNSSRSPSRNPSRSPSRSKSSPNHHRHGGMGGIGTGTEKGFTRMGVRIGRHRHGLHHENSSFSSSSSKASKEYDLAESCHIVARFKVNNLIELARAIKDEEDMCAKKRNELRENKKLSKKLAQNLRKKEKERRHNKRIYIRTLQYDNEIRLMKKMREVKLLW